DPLLLFELRGLSRQQLHAALLETPLGRALASSLAEADISDPAPVDSYHTRPQQTAETVGYGGFWSGKPLPAGPEPATPGLAGVLVRKAGAWPPFWNCDYPFIEAMAEFYERVRKANADGL
nr:hypothetical protein [Pseudomonadota bacterium]